MYYRYEIIDKDGNSYGLLTGLEKIGLNENEIYKLTKNFEKYLPIPLFYYQKSKNKKKNVFAYFTEQGKKSFQNSITNIINIVENKGYKIILKEQTNVGTKRLIYCDKYQVLIKTK